MTTERPSAWTRRTFLRWISGVGATLSGFLVGIPSLRSFASPVLRRGSDENWIRLGRTGSIRSGAPTKIDFVQTVEDAWLERRLVNSVWVVPRENGDPIVYNGRCTHLGCGYHFDEEDGRFKCPCHAGVFEVETGAVVAGPPPRSLDELDVKIQDGMLYARYEEFRYGIEQKVPV